MCVCVTIMKHEMNRPTKFLSYTKTRVSNWEYLDIFRRVLHKHNFAKYSGHSRKSLGIITLSSELVGCIVASIFDRKSFRRQSRVSLEKCPKVQDIEAWNFEDPKKIKEPTRLPTDLSERCSFC